MILMVVDVLGTVPKGLENRLGLAEIRENRDHSIFRIVKIGQNTE